MPKRKKTYKNDAVNPEDVTLALRNAAVLVRNFLDQRINEALTRGKNPAKTQGKFRARSRQTLREITQMYYDELAAYTYPPTEGEAPYLLAEELCLSFCGAALLIHLTKVEGKKIDAELLFE